jgi:hypothetical protein
MEIKEPKTIEQLIQERQPVKVKTITNERQDIIRQFVEELNKERIGTKFKPLTGRAVAIKLGMIKTNQGLYEFLSICKDYKNRNGSFGKRFFGGAKIK